MSKRTIRHLGIAFVIIAFLIAVFAPAIQKNQQGAHVVQQMAAFSEVCQHIEDYNKPPARISYKEINYDPNALGYANKFLFHKKYFGHEVVTYGDGRYVLSNRKGKIISEGDVFMDNYTEKIFRNYTNTEPYIHRR